MIKVWTDAAEAGLEGIETALAGTSKELHAYIKRTRNSLRQAIVCSSNKEQGVALSLKVA
jgi:hypothetical protein